MPNIIIASSCNLKCPYCFAQTVIQEQENNFITKEQLERILDWLSKEYSEHNPNKSKIGIIGGEPTIHPQFADILKTMNTFATMHKVPLILFTNGIKLKDYIYDIPTKMSILLNLNSPSIMTQKQWNDILETLEEAYQLGWLNPNEKMQQKLTLGCNLCMEIDDYSFFWEIAEKYSVSEVRVSVTAPTKEEYKKNKDKYFQAMLPKFIKFEEEACARNITIVQDCSQIPDCYFSNSDVRLKLRVSHQRWKKPSLCSPVIDITPDFKATSCFGVSELIDCSKFDSLADLHNYFLYKKIVPKTLRNNSGRCATCEKHDLVQCQGGCLGFTD